MIRNLFLGFIKLHLLLHAERAPVYSLAMIEELRRHGYDLSPGTLYPMLPGLEWAGYLCREERVVGGKVCKHYAITEAGRDALIEASAKIRDMVGEVVDRQGPVVLPDPGQADGGNDA